MSPEPPPPADSRASFSRFLAWALSALGLLVVLTAALLHFSPALLAPRPPAATVPDARPALPLKITEKKPVPLTVTLLSARSGKHVRVGTPVIISAYAALPPGASATIAISYTRNHGPQSLLALAQGSLATASWTPALPGQYEFTASALDSSKSSVFSHPVLIAADAAPALPVSVPVPVPVAMPVRIAAAVPSPARRLPEVHAKRLIRRQAAVRPAPPKLVTHRPAASEAYHVAAGAFIVRPVAETLAGALRRRGFHASVHPGPLLYRKPSFVVEVGSYLDPAAAQAQYNMLKHDGYPAYVFRRH